MKLSIIQNNYDTPKKKEFELVILVGEILLSSSAEIFRVEDTMRRIAGAFEFSNMDIFVIANGIFVTAEDKNHTLYAKTKHVPSGVSHLGKVEAVNDLSRKIEDKAYNIDECYERLHKINNMGEYPLLWQIATSGIGGGSFCYLLGGSLRDAFCVLLIAGFLGLFLFVSQTKGMNKSFKIILGCLLCSLWAALFMNIGIGENIDKIIIGSIIPVVPGVAFTNSIRDFLDQYYLSGSIRLLSALTIATCMAIGVGIALWIV